MIGRMLGMAVLAVAVSTAAWAAEGEPEYSATYKKCMDDSQGITVKVRECIADEHGRQDAELNRVYRELTAKSTPEVRATLVRAQRAWLAFREAQCAYDAEPESGGTLWLILIDSCHLDMLARRVKEFRENVTTRHGFAD